MQLLAGRWGKTFRTALSCLDADAFFGVPGPHGARGNPESHPKAVCSPRPGSGYHQGGDCSLFQTVLPGVHLTTQGGP